MIKQKRFFSQNRALFTNPDLEKIERKLRRLNDKATEILDYKNELNNELVGFHYDKEHTSRYLLALVKIENNQKLSAVEEESMAVIKEKYPTIFDTEVLESDPEVETSPEYKERKQVKDVLDHLNEQITDINNETVKSDKEYAETCNKYKALEKAKELSNTMSTAESSTSVKASELTSREASKESAQTNNSPSDYIDNLPSDYNPFDDIGND